MSINKINPNVNGPQKANFQKFDKILSKREKAYIEKSFPAKKANGQKPARAKEKLGKYIDIKI